jgi:glycosyltransferase involved in cell wall biosynthesis
MRILQVVTRSDSGGAQVIVSTLSGALAVSGHTVAVASGPEGGGEAWEDMDSSISRFTLGHLVRVVSPANDVRAVLELRELYRAWKPDIIHLHTSKAGALGRLAAGSMRSRVVYTMHGYDQLKRANRKLLLVDKALRNHCGAIVAVSKADLQAMRADGYDACLIRNGTRDATHLRRDDTALLQRIQELRTRYRVLALMVARDAAPKRIDLARKAAALLGDGIGMLWIGGDPRPDDPANFHALGTVNNAGAYMGLCDLFLLLTDHEGLSVSMLEAYSAGVPVIASAVPGCLEALDLAGPGQGSYGVAVENGAHDIATAVKMLSDKDAIRMGMGQAGRRVWDAQYSSDRMAQGYLVQYKELYF